MTFQDLEWPEAVQITSTRDDTIAGYAPRFVKTWDGNDLVQWAEGGHVRTFAIAKTTRWDAEAFAFVDPKGDTFLLQPLTLERYDRHVKPRTIGKPGFRSERAMLDALRAEW